MPIRSTLTGTAAAFATGLVLLATVDGALARHVGDARVLKIDRLKTPDRDFTKRTEIVVTGKVPPGTNAPVSDPVVRNHSGPNGEGGVTVTAAPRKPSPCSGFFHACLEESRDHRSGWKAPSGSAVRDHRN